MTVGDKQAGTAGPQYMWVMGGRGSVESGVPDNRGTLPSAQSIRALQGEEGGGKGTKGALRVRGSWGRVAAGREAQPSGICLPLPWLQPQLASPSLSLTLNLLYNFKIKFFKKQEREST